MKIVIIGGSGLIGSRTGKRLQALGHEVVLASPSLGIDAVTGRGLAEAMKGAEVLIDVANSPSFEEQAVMSFFVEGTQNLLAAGRAAGIRHHVALSIVGVDRPPGNVYFRAKVAQENLIQKGGIPFTIIRSTQFFEFLSAIADINTRDGRVYLPPVAFQPIAAVDVSRFVAEVAVGSPATGMIEIAGPEKASMSDLTARFLAARSDQREVVADSQAGYFGAAVDDQSLVPLADAMLGDLTLDRWVQENGH